MDRSFTSSALLQARYRRALGVTGFGGCWPLGCLGIRGMLVVSWFGLLSFYERFGSFAGFGVQNMGVWGYIRLRGPLDNSELIIQVEK